MVAKPIPVAFMAYNRGSPLISHWNVNWQVYCTWLSTSSTTRPSSPDQSSWFQQFAKASMRHSLCFQICTASQEESHPTRSSYSYGTWSCHDRMGEESSICCLSCWSCQPLLKVTTPYNLGISILLFPWWQCLLHCGSRMHNALLSGNTKFPLLLPTKDNFTDLVIHSTSVKQLHAGDNSTLTTLCQSYWVPSVRQHIKTLIDKCITCRKEQPTMHQTHHPFPSQECNKHNLLKSQEWTKQELCMFKMLELKQRSTYGDCLFTCTTTRAIHLDCWSLLTRLSQICKSQISSKESNIGQCLNISISKQWTKETVSISCAQGNAC